MNKGLEALKQYRSQQTGVNVYADELLDIVEKELRALEIIKENALYVDWTWLFDCVVNNESYEDYVEGCEATNETTYADKKEYDLLKGVLL